MPLYLDEVVHVGTYASIPAVVAVVTACHQDTCGHVSWRPLPPAVSLQGLVTHDHMTTCPMIVDDCGSPVICLKDDIESDTICMPLHSIMKNEGRVSFAASSGIKCLYGTRCKGSSKSTDSL